MENSARVSIKLRNSGEQTEGGRRNRKNGTSTVEELIRVLPVTIGIELARSAVSLIPLFMWPKVFPWHDMEFHRVSIIDCAAQMTMLVLPRFGTFTKYQNIDRRSCRK